MVQELAWLTDGFAGLATHTWCFLHVINLVVKSLLRQFDVKRKEGDSMADLDAEILHEMDLEDLADLMMIEADEDNLDAADAGDGDDSEDGLVDEVAELSEHEHRALERDILPVKFVLAKVWGKETHHSLF